MYTRVDAPTEKKKLPVHCAETRLSEASTRATAGAIFQTEIVKRSRRITVFCFEIHIGTRIRIVSACQIPFLRENIEGLYNRNRVRSRRITVFCFKIQIRISRVTTFCSVARQRTCVYEYSCTSTKTTPPICICPPPHPPFPQMLRPRSSRLRSKKYPQQGVYECGCRRRWEFARTEGGGGVILPLQ